MAEATRKRGFEYFGVADHSISAHYAGGLSLDEIAKQHREADKLNKRYGKSFRILKGIEADILGDGSLDYPDRVLDKFDFVVASIHSRFKMTKKEQTDRILKAIKNPHTTIIGHMTGRQLLRRPGYDIDIDRILKACAEHGVGVEINAHPWRLDLDWRWHQKALDYGCIFSINPDAHSIRELDHMHWGVEMARKGGVPPDRVLNAMPLAKLLRHLQRRRQTASRAAWRAGERRHIRENERMDAGSLKSNMFEMEWPPRSGRRQSFPELDRAGWFGINEARAKILKGQAVFLDRLLETLASS
jgi:DNA polymerase (family 10)